MDSTSPLSSMKAGFVRSAYNCNLGLISGYVKRDGFTTALSSAYGVTSFSAGLEYRTSGAARRVVLYATDGVSAELVYTTVAGGAPTVITSGLDGAARPSLVQVRDQLFFFNGSDDPKVYDGSNWKQLGITRPASAPTAGSPSQTTGGNKNLLGRYAYVYTYYNSVTKAESSPSDLYIFTLTGSNNVINLALTAGNSATADTIRIYSTVGGGNELFLESEIAVASTTYASSAADSALGQPLEMDNSRLADVTSAKGKYAVVAGNRVFVVTGENEVRYSKIGLYESKPESYEAKAVVDTMGTAGNNDGIVGLATIADTVIVLKRRSIGKLEAIGLPDTSVPEDNVVFTYKEISGEIGAVSHFGAVQIENELFFVGRNNIYRTDGQAVRAASESIQANVRAMSFTASQQLKISAINDTKFKRAYFQLFSGSGSTVPTWTFVADYQRFPEVRWTIYRPGTNTTTHPSLRVGCFVKVTSSSDGSDLIWFGNLDADGQMYQMNSGTSDNTKGIYFQIVTRPFSMGQPILTKLYKKAYIAAIGDGNNYDVTVSAIYNLSEQEETSQAKSLYNGGAQWDVAQWDTDVWANNDLTTLEYYAHRKAKFQQLVMRQTSANAPLTIYGWASTASIFGPF
jgi:hypothetical protein